MALVVEDGTGVEDADAYVTVAEFEAYWSARGVSFTTSNEQHEAAIVLATQYVDGVNNWKGFGADPDQFLDWPRVGMVNKKGRVIPSDEIPRELKSAVCEYAKRQLAADLRPDVEDTGTVKRVKTKVDVIETETEYQDNTGGYFGVKAYPTADAYVEAFINHGRLGRVGC